MDKKVLKWYESPVMEAVELEVEGFLCASGSNGDAENVGGDGMGEEE